MINTTAQNEYDQAVRLKSVNGHLYYALEEDELDEYGNFIPCVEKRLVIDGISPNLMKMPQCIAESFKDYVDFFTVTRVRYAISNGRFNGKVSMRVKNFIKIPPKYFKLKLSPGTAGGAATINVKTECFGYDKSSQGPIVEKSKLKCFACKGEDHLARNCPFRKNRSFGGNNHDNNEEFTIPSQTSVAKMEIRRERRYSFQVEQSKERASPVPPESRPISPRMTRKECKICDSRYRIGWVLVVLPGTKLQLEPFSVNFN